MKRTLLSWSSGKDSAWTLHEFSPGMELFGRFKKMATCIVLCLLPCRHKLKLGLLA
jgi:hypothetical protein